MNYPKVFIIILNWNGRLDTLECLESVFKMEYPNFDVIVVDNGSTDNSVTTIKTTFPHVILIENKENLGFAGGNNVGIQYVLDNGADFVFLLNNDTIVDPNILNALLGAWCRLEHPGHLGCKIFFSSTPVKIQHMGGIMELSSTSIGHFIGDGEIDSGQYDKIMPCDFVSGCALFTHRSVINSTGLFDEMLYLYCEDTDWGLRARKAGYCNYTIPNARLWHKVSSSTYPGSPIIPYYSIRNQFLVAKKHHLQVNCFKLTLSRIFESLKSGYWLRYTMVPILLTAYFHFKVGKGGKHPRWMKANKTEHMEYKLRSFIHYLKRSLKLLLNS